MEEFEKEVPNGKVVKTKCLTLDCVGCDDIILNSIGTDDESENEYRISRISRKKMDLMRVKNETFFNKNVFQQNS